VKVKRGKKRGEKEARKKKTRHPSPGGEKKTFAKNKGKKEERKKKDMGKPGGNVDKSHF